jgi:predicted phage terminase large subunit-like protein
MVDGQWVDSWDMAFKDSEGGSWVVGQRWVRVNANRFLVAQQRGRWNFTKTIEKLEQWALTDDQERSPWGNLVHQRLIEDKANGPAIIATLKDKIAGLKPVNPHSSKIARAQAITPEVESGNVYLPHPSDYGNEWVQDLLSELRNFPHDAADDQVDALTQALEHLRGNGRGQITNPAAAPPLGGTQRRGTPGISLPGTGGISRAAAARTSDGLRRGLPGIGGVPGRRP